MAIAKSLITQIENTIGNIPTNLNSSTIDNIYEVYLFTLVLKAAQNEGTTIRLLDQRNPNPSVLYFRTSPGYITSNLRAYTFAQILFANKPPLEGHVGIRVSGKSQVLHECDVSVLLQSEADLCRRSSDRVAPRSSKVILNIEAKFYTTPLNFALGRSFLGLIADFSSQESFFITNTSSDSVEKLLSHKSRA